MGKQENKQYLGDSVYAEYDGSGIVLTTDNGLGPTNVIYLELEVLAALVRFAGEIVRIES